MVEKRKQLPYPRATIVQCYSIVLC